jgi:hypothetical protein
MADRPTQQDIDLEIGVPAPVWVAPSMRLTKEQLAAAQRTRDYHVRKLQKNVTRQHSGMHAGDSGSRSEY